MNQQQARLDRALMLLSVDTKLNLDTHGPSEQAEENLGEQTLRLRRRYFKPRSEPNQKLLVEDSSPDAGCGGLAEVSFVIANRDCGGLVVFAMDHANAHAGTQLARVEKLQEFRILLVDGQNLHVAADRDVG